MSVQNLLDICLQVVEIFIDLHGSGVVHRDLKPSNLVIKEVGNKPIVKLIDFSDSMIVEDGPWLN